MNDSVSDTDVGYDTMGSTGAQRKRNGPNLGTSIQSDFTVMGIGRLSANVLEYLHSIDCDGLWDLLSQTGTTKMEDLKELEACDMEEWPQCPLKWIIRIGR